MTFPNTPPLFRRPYCRLDFVHLGDHLSNMLRLPVSHDQRVASHSFHETTIKSEQPALYAVSANVAIARLIPPQAHIVQQRRAARPRLKQIFELDRLDAVPGRHGEMNVGIIRRPHANRRIARESEPFAR